MLGIRALDIHHELFSLLFLVLMLVIDTREERATRAYHVCGDERGQVERGCAVEREVVLDHTIGSVHV